MRVHHLLCCLAFATSSLAAETAATTTTTAAKRHRLVMLFDRGERQTLGLIALRLRRAATVMNAPRRSLVESLRNTTRA